MVSFQFCSNQMRLNPKFGIHLWVEQNVKMSETEPRNFDIRALVTPICSVVWPSTQVDVAKIPHCENGNHHGHERLKIIVIEIARYSLFASFPDP